MNNLFENVLREASKSRFIDKVWEDLEKDPNYVMSQTIEPTAKFPSRETITKWVDSGAADEFLHKPMFADGRCFNWQKFTTGAVDKETDIPLYVYLINAYLEYQNKGGSIKQKKDDPKNCFFNSGLKVVKKGDCSGADMAFLPELETDKFFFVCPLKYEAAKWMDSFDCCASGARWCIGWEDSDTYWENYVKDSGNLFILAVNKENYKKARKSGGEIVDSIKYMIQLNPYDVNECQAWVQNDDPDECIKGRQFKRFFGHDINEFAGNVIKNVLCDDTDYGVLPTTWCNEDGEPQLYDEDLICDDTLYFKEMIKGAGVVSRQDIFDAAWEKLTIDFSGCNFDGRYFAGPLSEYEDVLKASDLFDWMDACGISNSRCATFRNAEIRKFIFDVEDDESKTKADIHFEDCNIDKILITENAQCRPIDCSILLRNSTKVRQVIVPDNTYTRFVDCYEDAAVKEVKFQHYYNFMLDLQQSLLPKDYFILPDLENKEWAFAVPLTDIGMSYFVGPKFGLVRSNVTTSLEANALQGLFFVVALNKDVAKYSCAIPRVEPFNSESYAVKEFICFDPHKTWYNSAGLWIWNSSGVDTGQLKEFQQLFGISLQQLFDSLKKNAPEGTLIADNIKDIDNPEFLDGIKQYLTPLVESKLFEKVFQLS